MKVSLVQPLHADHGRRKKQDGGFFKPAQLTMPYIAAFTPPEFEVEIFDEIAGPLDVEKIDGDVVGVTAVTPFAPRVYELARAFRARGQTVVMGGPHASALPEEAAAHVDAVVVGQGDVLWPRALRDWKAGRLERIYRSDSPPPLEGLPRPRWDLTNPRSYVVPQVVQASQGCPFRCEFCSLRLVFPKYRTRPVGDVVREVEQIPYRHVVFWDDNIVGSPAWAKDLFRALRPLRKRWYGQATITMAKDPELVRLAAESGCGGLFVGLESFSADSLRSTNKGFNRVESYRKDVRLLLDHGIAVMSGLVFGFDHDGPDTFRSTLDGAIDIGLTGIAASILTPYPGTAFFERMRREGRLRTFEWSRYTSDEVVFEPRRLTAEQLRAGHDWVGQQFHTHGNIFRRWWKGRGVDPRVFFLSNYANRRYFGSFPEVAEDPCSAPADAAPFGGGAATALPPVP